jgi:hypothetical protein
MDSEMGIGHSKERERKYKTRTSKTILVFTFSLLIIAAEVLVFVFYLQNPNKKTVAETSSSAENSVQTLSENAATPARNEIPVVVEPNAGLSWEGTWHSTAGTATIYISDVTAKGFNVGGDDVSGYRSYSLSNDFTPAPAYFRSDDPNVAICRMYNLDHVDALGSDFDIVYKLILKEGIMTVVGKGRYSSGFSGKYFRGDWEERSIYKDATEQQLKAIDEFINTALLAAYNPDSNFSGGFIVSSHYGSYLDSGASTPDRVLDFAVNYAKLRYPELVDKRRVFNSYKESIRYDDLVQVLKNTLADDKFSYHMKELQRTDNGRFSYENYPEERFYWEPYELTWDTWHFLLKTYKGFVAKGHYPDGSLGLYELSATIYVDSDRDGVLDDSDSGDEYYGEARIYYEATDPLDPDTFRITLLDGWPT